MSRRIKRSQMLLAGAALLIGADPARADSRPAAPRTAHDAYVAAINSNDVATLMADLTDDVVFQAPGATEMVGKATVRRWAAAYVAAYRTRWQKTSIGFTRSGGWAFERYTYRSTDTDRKTGAVTHDVGKGINIFRLGAGGKWRVAVDGWSSDRPAP